MWTRHKQPQHCGVQLSARQRRWRGEPPKVATEGRETQDHEHAARDAGGEPEAPGESPASAIENRDGDASARDVHVDWDAVVQPERARTQAKARDALPLPEGK